MRPYKGGNINSSNKERIHQPAYQGDCVTGPVITNTGTGTLLWDFTNHGGKRE